MSLDFAETARAALSAATEPELAVFDPETLAELPAAAQRLLGQALPPGVSLAMAVQLTMQGEIKLGGRWLPFNADQILRAGVGFVWAPTVASRFLRFTGADVLGPDGARIEFRFYGRIPVVRGSGPDIARSAAGRLAAETVAWLPQALTPQAGAVWAEIDHERATVTLDAAGQPTDVEIAVDDDGQLLWLGLQRWKDSAKPPALAAFGGSVDGLFTTTNGIRIAGGGVVGWDWDTPKQADGEFFRYTITSATYLEPDPKRHRSGNAR